MSNLKKMLIIAIALVAIILILFGNSTHRNTSIVEQIKDKKIILDSDYTKMGESYIDKIFDKYDTVTFGIQKDNFLGIAKEPIEWIVLAREEGKALLMTKYIIDCKPFDYVDIEKLNDTSEETKNNYKNVTWESCSLRKWLNSEFIESSFSAEEKKHIAETVIVDTKTADKIFCLSEGEYKEYFNNGGYYEKDRNIGDHHIYYNGATIRSKKAQSYDKYNLLQPDETYDYWLRDRALNLSEQGIEFGSTKTIGPYGEISFSINIDPYCGVRPAMWVSLE